MLIPKYDNLQYYKVLVTLSLVSFVMITIYLVYSVLIKITNNS